MVYDVFAVNKRHEINNKFHYSLRPLKIRSEIPKLCIVIHLFLNEKDEAMLWLINSNLTFFLPFFHLSSTFYIWLLASFPTLFG